MRVYAPEPSDPRSWVLDCDAECAYGGGTLEEGVKPHADATVSLGEEPPRAPPRSVAPRPALKFTRKQWRGLLRVSSVAWAPRAVEATAQPPLRGGADFALARAQPGGGLGLFALMPLRAGAAVTRYVGEAGVPHVPLLRGRGRGLQPRNAHGASLERSRGDHGRAQQGEARTGCGHPPAGLPTGPPTSTAAELTGLHIAHSAIRHVAATAVVRMLCMAEWG